VGGDCETIGTASPRGQPSTLTSLHCNAMLARFEHIVPDRDEHLCAISKQFFSARVRQRSKLIERFNRQGS